MPERRPSHRFIRFRTRATVHRGERRRPGAASLAHAGTLTAWLAVAAAGIAPAERARAADEPDRGRALYENHCGDCHGEAIHRRETPRVRSREELYGWVAAWSVHAGMSWSEEDVESVTRYLSREVYGFTR